LCIVHKICPGTLTWQRLGQNSEFNYQSIPTSFTAGFAEQSTKLF